jgi:competence protein ComEA
LLPWPLTAQATLVLLLCAALAFLLGRWSQERSSPFAASATVANARLDLNRATAEELRHLPGVGPSLAERIIEHRTQHGPFRGMDELRSVSGVGAKTLERLRPFFAAPPSSDPEDEATRAPPPRPKSSRKPAKTGKLLHLTAPIDVNRADLTELQKLPGIGPKMSQRIVDERSLRGPFKAVEDLRRVSGIGPKTLEKLRPYVILEAPSPPTTQLPTRTAYNE